MTVPHGPRDVDGLAHGRARAGTSSADAPDSRGRHAVVVLVALVGVAAVGVVAAAIDGDGPRSDWLRLLDGLLNSAALWVSCAFLVGGLARSRYLGALLGVTAETVLVVGYYWYGLAFGDRRSLGLGAIWPTISFWLLLGVVAGASAGVGGSLVRTRLRTLALLALAGVWIGLACIVALGMLPYLGNDLVQIWGLGVHLLTGGLIAVWALWRRRRPVSRDAASGLVPRGSESEGTAAPSGESSTYGPRRP